MASANDAAEPGLTPSNPESAHNSTKQLIDPYNVSGGKDAEGKDVAIDYDRLIEEFGTQRLTQEHLDRFERVTGKPPHRLMRRKLFFSHRDFDRILDVYQQQGYFMLYTGRGPSSGSMHLGHTIPFLFTKELQELFDVPLVIMLTEDEKYLHTRNKNGGQRSKGNDIQDFIRYAHENAKDIIALGFDPKKTFIYTDYEYVGGHFEMNISEMSSMLPYNQIRGAMGFSDSVSVGLTAFAARQMVAAFPSSYPALFGKEDYRPPDYPLSALQPHKDLAALPCLIPCAIDQEPYFRMLRERCERMAQPSPKTCLILSKFLTALQGPGGKMSASNPNSAIFMSDTASQIKNKINKHAFSGGKESLEEHRRDGGNPDVDVAYTYLSYFLEDDEELKHLEEGYMKGEILTGDMKKRCIDELQKVVAAFQERRAKVTHEVMREFMRPRKLEFKGNPKVQRREDTSVTNGEAASGAPTGAGGEDEGKMSKNQVKKMQKEAELKAKREGKEREKELAMRPKDCAEDAAP